jgi:hypothetical protein
MSSLFQPNETFFPRYKNPRYIGHLSVSVYFKGPQWWVRLRLWYCMMFHQEKYYQGMKTLPGYNTLFRCSKCGTNGGTYEDCT